MAEVSMADNRPVPCWRMFSRSVTQSLRAFSGPSQKCRWW